MVSDVARRDTARMMIRQQIKLVLELANEMLITDDLVAAAFPGDHTCEDRGRCMWQYLSESFGSGRLIYNGYQSKLRAYAIARGPLWTGRERRDRIH